MISAGQYLYTACGKNKSRGFDIFSKTDDIEENEIIEINELMQFSLINRSAVKLGYFNLSSGRYCIARSCYVGNYYSENTVTDGNYIIHTFVFDKMVNFAPLGFYAYLGFKSFLTEDEWKNGNHDLNNKTEIPCYNMVNWNNSDTSYLKSSNIASMLKLLIEAIMKSKDNNTPIHIKDNDNIEFWFKALNLCLPPIIQNKVSFCTYFTNTIKQDSIASKIQIRFNRTETPSFTHDVEAQQGNYAFEMKSNIKPQNLTPGKYSECIVDILLNKGKSSVEDYVDNINEFLQTYAQRDIIKASKMTNLLFGYFDYLPTADDIFEAVKLINDESYKVVDIAQKLVNSFNKYQFNINQKLYQKIYL
jgi:hypothetical protein